MINVEKHPPSAGWAEAEPTTGAVATPPPAIQVIGIGRRDPKRRWLADPRRQLRPQFR